MGFRFRKSFGSGPFRVNVSKSGIGWSVGGKGSRFSKNASGGYSVGTSIPGTGVSYRKDIGKRSSRRKKKSGGFFGCFGSFILVLMIIGLLSSCFGGGESADTPAPEDIQVEAPASELVPEETPEDPQDSDPSDSFLEMQQDASAESLAILTGREEENAASEDAEVPVVEETEVPEETDVPEEDPVVIVYITETGTKYHRAGCRHLDESKYEIERDAAIAQGYEPCGSCY